MRHRKGGRGCQSCLGRCSASRQFHWCLTEKQALPLCVAIENPTVIRGFHTDLFSQAGANESRAAALTVSSMEMAKVDSYNAQSALADSTGFVKGLGTLNESCSASTSPLGL